jgi:Putative regulator of cell autolysis
MKIKLPRYTSKDYLVLGVVLAPITLVMNSVIFGARFWTSWPVFLFATAVTAFAFTIDFILCGGIAVILKKRFPLDSQVVTRLGLMILSFLLVTSLFLLTLFRGYETVSFLDYTFNESGFIWAFMGMGIVNIFLTFLHEGIARYDSWKQNMQETEALKKVYRQSRLLGLKSQVNPHFLFNSLNSLSCLIQDDQEKGERFLDEMTRVYRYMLQNDEEQLVDLGTEVKFIDSYLYLLRERHGEGLRIIVDITECDREKKLPPLALQTIVENIVAQNTISKDEPLDIYIYTEDDGAIAIANNVQPRVVADASELGSGLDNLVKKYELLSHPPIMIAGNSMERIIRLPLICKEEVAV